MSPALLKYNFQKLTILHLSSEKTWRGGEQQIAYLIQELKTKGIHNLVACRKGSAFEAYCRRQDIPCFSLPFANSLDLRTAMGLRKICSSAAVDLMHLHSSKSHGVAVLSAWLGNRTPMVLSRRVDFPLKRNWLSQKKYNHKGIRTIACVSDAIKEMVQKDIDEPAKAITIYSGIDLQKFSTDKTSSHLRRQYAIPDDHWLIGNTSALADHKDYYTFVDTAEILAQQNFPAYYFIIGKGPQEENIKAYVAAKGLQDKIIFTGFLNNIPEVLPELDLFLMTSKTEGLGTSLLDAFASKVPVVATAAGGIPEIVKHEQSGLLVDIGDSRQLAGEVMRILQNPALRERTVEGAWELVQEFDKRITAEKTLALYHKVLDAPT